MRNEEKELESYLPSGWEAAARETGALQRSRKIKTAEELLELNLLYLTGAGSFQNTAALMTVCHDIRLNKEATRKRIRGSWQWLRWMGHRISLENGYVMQAPEWLGQRSVYLVDATDVALPGGKSNDYRIHYAFDLFRYTAAYTEVTPIAQGGEKLTRYPVKKGDIVIGDRIYGTIAGIEHVQAAGGSYVLRLKTKAFLLYDRQGTKISLLDHLQGITPWEPISLDCFYRDRNGQLQPVRIVATRKDEAETAKADDRLRKVAIRKQWKAIRPETKEMAQYIVLATNLPDTAAQVSELYRARWQIERVFRRLKGLFGLGDPPCFTPDSVKAWFYGKLFLAALCEVMTMDQPFSPDPGQDADPG